MKFTKMHGLGNDYIYVNALKEKVNNPSELAIRLSDRNFGIGGDGLVLIGASGSADFSMRMFNADGSEAEMCGNAIRCVAKFVRDKRLTNKPVVDISTLGGIKRIELITDTEGVVTGATVDMGEPKLEAAQIPADLGSGRIVDYPLEVDGKEYRVTCVNMGNPHCVVFVDDTKAVNIEKIGPKFENHTAFPRRINTEFVKVNSRNDIDMRVWERGSGETLACGTGACASVVACVLNGLTDNKVTVHLLGGDLYIEYNGTVLMRGGAVTVFEGEINVQD